jgi:hypothetical protein
MAWHIKARRLCTPCVLSSCRHSGLYGSANVWGCGGAGRAMLGRCVVAVRLQSPGSRSNTAAYSVRVKRVPWRTYGERLAQHRLNASSSFASTSPSKPALGRIAVRYVCTTGSSSTTRIFMARTLSSRLSVWSRRNRHAENLSLDLSTQTFPSVVGHLQECLHDLGIELASRPLRNFLPCCLQRLCRAVR